MLVILKGTATSHVPGGQSFDFLLHTYLFRCSLIKARKITDVVQHAKENTFNSRVLRRLIKRITVRTCHAIFLHELYYNNTKTTKEEGMMHAVNVL